MGSGAPDSWSSMRFGVQLPVAGSYTPPRRARLSLATARSWALRVEGGKLELLEVVGGGKLELLELLEVVGELVGVILTSRCCFLATICTFLIIQGGDGGQGSTSNGPCLVTTRRSVE